MQWRFCIWASLGAKVWNASVSSHKIIQLQRANTMHLQCSIQKPTTQTYDDRHNHTNHARFKLIHCPSIGTCGKCSHVTSTQCVVPHWCCTHIHSQNQTPMRCRPSACHTWLRTPYRRPQPRTSESTAAKENNHTEKEELDQNGVRPVLVAWKLPN